MTNDNVLKDFHVLIQRKDLVFLDTETTGLGATAEVCEIAIVDFAGNVLLNTHVKPTVPITRGAESVHHISEAMVKDAPTFGDLMPKIRKIFTFSHICIYNSEYDIGVIRQSRKVNGSSGLLRDQGVTCIMKLYSNFWGAWNPDYQSNTYQSLSNAAAQQGIPLPAGMSLHSAVADAQLTRLLTIELGGRYEIPF
jgi:DNA polymerase III subunit epsilon